MRATFLRFMSSVAAAALLALAVPASAQITLGTAQNFGVLGGSAVTNTGASTITGEVGVSPQTSVTGFPPGVVVGGTIHRADAVAGQAQTDLTAAYNAISGTPCTVNLTGQNLGGLTLTPGVYCFDSEAALSGILTLNFQGNPNALFLFKIGSTLITASGSSVNIINGAGAETCPQNVFFQVGSSATLGTGTTFRGNILALTSITLTTGANLSGRALARNGAVTLDTNNVTRCGPASCPVITVNPATLPNGTVGSVYNQLVTATGGMPAYTYSISSGALPGGLTFNPTTGAITGTPTAAGTFRFSITAADATGCLGTRAYTLLVGGFGCPAITLNPAALPPGNTGVTYNQTITATGGTGSYNFTLMSGTLPPGLTLNQSTGVISGLPSTPGFFDFTIGATDSAGCPASSRGLSITISLAAPTSVPALGTGGLALLCLLLATVGLAIIPRYAR